MPEKTNDSSAVKLKILHTADVHLREPNDERWKALEEIVRIVRHEKVDLLVISGDLFNKAFNQHELRVPIRNT